MVWQVLEMLAEGADVTEIRKAFPALTAAYIRAALEYASSITQGSNVLINTRAPVPA